jgi:hypothetical protein
MVLYILTFTFLERRRDDKDSGPNCSKHSMNLVCSLCLRPFSYGVVPKYLLFPYFCTTCFCYNFIIYTVQNELEYEHEFWIAKNKKRDGACYFEVLSQHSLYIVLGP